MSDAEVIPLLPPLELKIWRAALAITVDGVRSATIDRIAAGASLEPDVVKSVLKKRERNGVVALGNLDIRLRAVDLAEDDGQRQAPRDGAA